MIIAMNRFIYLLGGITFILGSFRVYNLRIYEFKYYPPLDLGEYYWIVSFLFALISIYFFYIFIQYKHINNKNKYTKCPRCKDVFNYKDLKEGKCPNCEDIDTIDLDEYFKKYPDELEKS